MYLMRIGPCGSEKPIARVDGDNYVDLSDVVGDFDEKFFGGGVLESRSWTASPRGLRMAYSPKNAT
jgi:hypothetical protein